MTAQLTLEVKDYHSDAAWRWVLSDAEGRFLADHEVKLDPADSLYRGFADLPGYLRYQPHTRPEDDTLNELGAWMGANAFGKVGEKLLTYEQRPARVVLVRVPAAAQELLFRPLELAHLGGKPLVERGFRFIYTLADAPSRPTAPKAITGSLRFLAVFSLPHNASPLNLRRERYELQRQLRRFAQMRGTAVEVRVIQFGATRETLKEALEEDPGWDVIHFSGHGEAGELLLEQADGRLDKITTDDLAELLQPARARLKLLTLSACYSGAADVNAARRMVGLADEPRRAGADDVWADFMSAPALPSLAQRLAAELDCAALAMRYPVGDDFATDLGLKLYDALLDKRQPLPAALQTALGDALDPRRDPAITAQPGFSRITPILFRTPAADLRLPAPARPPDFQLPAAGLFKFPPEPERFVGRLMPMLRASQALAPESEATGVLFYGMAGAGKTSCALELAYRHERGRFVGGVWYKAPDEGHDIEGALTQWALKMEDQLPGLELVGLMDDPQEFRRKALPRLRALMEQNAILLVMDNLESLLTGEGEWRDARWGELINALLSHRGPSRLVLTSRRLPKSLARDARPFGFPKPEGSLQVEAIHALSFGESVVLARDLPHLKTLFKSPETLPLLQRILEMAQGHPKLLELADGLVANPSTGSGQAPDKLAALLQSETEAAAAPSTSSGQALAAFFQQGETARSEDDFMAVLYRWTEGTAASLGPTARLLFHFLARMEDDDRTREVIDANWEDFLKRLLAEQSAVSSEQLAAAAAALDAGEAGLDSALSQLAQAGLVEIIAPDTEPEPAPDSSFILHPSSFTLYRIHPGVAEAARAAADEAVLKAADIELGDYFIAMHQHGLETEMQGGGRRVVQGARHAAPYLMRAERWKEASTLLENMVARDKSPTTLALAIPLLRRIAAATTGTERELIDAGGLAGALLYAGRYAEAEQMERDRIAKCVAQDNYRLASVGSGQLLNLLMLTGRLEEALQTAEAKADYARRAGLGPWSQLADEAQRLQVLNAMGRYAEVLAAVETPSVRPQLKELPEQSGADEAADPWSVRETLLDTGREAALGLEQWETALNLNAAILDYTRQRGADEVELARTRFNDYSSLLRLKRYRDARALLEGCRAAFEQASAIYELGMVYTALADLEDTEGNRPAAVRFEHLALRYKYQAGRPEDCAISHNNLAGYLERSGAAPEMVLAHRLADGVICFQTGSGGIAQTIHNLALSPLPPAAQPFEQVCAIVEQVVGVRFRELFARLPQRAPSGDAAIAAVWEMALQEKAEGGRMKDEEMQAILREFEPLLQDIAAVARGDESKREEIEATLLKLEENGWHIAEAARRIWAGERDAEALTAGIDPNSAALVRRVLELVGEG